MIEVGCGDSEPVPASLARSCPRSFRSASVARYGQDDGLPVLAVRGAEPNPLTPFPVKEGGTEKIWGDDRSWMRKFGTGAGFAPRSCPRSFSLRSQSLPSVRMTDFAESEIPPLRELRRGLWISVGGERRFIIAGGFDRSESMLLTLALPALEAALTGAN
jgi:hypothetical protein